jgi:hypothetical protein
MPFTHDEIANMQKVACDYYNKQYQKSLRPTFLYEIKTKYDLFYWGFKNRIKDTLDVLFGRKYAEYFDCYDDVYIEDSEEL